MSVTEHRDSKQSNVLVTNQWRVHFEAYSMGAATKVLDVANAPIQRVSTTGNATIRLPLAALNGTLWLIQNNAAAAETITVTDDAGSPVTIATLAADTAGLFQKEGAAYVCLIESAAIA